MSNNSSYYSPGRAMLIDEGTTSSHSRNPSPDIILVIANPNTGRPGQSGNPETPGAVSTAIKAPPTDSGPAPRNPLGIEGVNDGNHKGDQRRGEPDSSPALRPISPAT